ncbi:Hypothetical_protein [Hexamita inflata]|uniref:Hypothetical_protein n=1 Tax=Hexamita inflata TaxID=28002 RepID=A0AA86PCF7_9EUKA|nr:Hypothetical protein HINF_LOCUS21279 [Hexamita inflata]
MSFSLDLRAIDKWQIVDIFLLKGMPVDIRQDCFNQNQYFRMSDKASLNLLNPALIHDYIEYGHYANAVAGLMLFPLFISYINYDEQKSYWYIWLENFRNYTWKIQIAMEQFNFKK